MGATSRFPKRKPGYLERCRHQTLRWAMGFPKHNNIDDECCIDFSCCVPELFETDPTKRWDYYRQFVAEHCS